jgi:general secretion pathway protein J
VAKVKQTGFTLLEVLLAIGITALIGVSSYTLLSQTIRTRDHLSDQAETLRQVQLASTIIQNDLRQISARVIRDQYGDHQPALKVGGYSLYGFLEFTRSGVSNPLKLNKSNMLRVAYQLEDDRLIRNSWAVLDQAPDSTPREQTLLKEVLETEVKVLAKDKWISVWPNNEEQLPSASSLSELPKAISFKLVFENGKEINWIERILGGE